jgi:hypothetical protein
MLGSALAATGTASKRVLLLYDEDKEFPGLAVLHQSLRTTLKAAFKDDVDLYTESRRGRIGSARSWRMRCVSPQ